jgi:protein arginine N-methyltransferase 3
LTPLLLLLLQVHDMDLATMTADQQDFTTTFTLTANSSSSSTVTVAAVVLWFDVEFSERFCKDCPVTLSTSPSAEVTHWAHAVLPLQRSIQLAAAAAAAGGSSGGSSGPPSSVQCRLSMARSRKQHRSLDISLEVGVGCDAPQARVYTMEVTGTD